MTAPTLTADELAQFHGSDELYRHPLMAAYCYTQGVRHLARRGNSYWLLDIIFSYQTAAAVRAEPFQVWRLVVSDSVGVVTCTNGNDDVPIVRQTIPYTDFPLPEIELWLEGHILMLPSER